MFTCPIDEIFCPYYDKNTGGCSLPNPADDCANYADAYLWDDELEEDCDEWEEDNKEDE